MARVSLVALLLLLALSFAPAAALRTLSQKGASEAPLSTSGGETSPAGADAGEDPVTVDRRRRREQTLSGAEFTGKRPRGPVTAPGPVDTADQVGEVTAEAVTGGDISGRFSGSYSTGNSVTGGGGGPSANQRDEGEPVRSHAELFLVDDMEQSFDLNYTSLTFDRDGRLTCRRVALQLPVDPVGGAVLPMVDDSMVEVFFPTGFAFPMRGALYTSASVSSNGYLTLGTRARSRSQHRATLEAHFQSPRVSGLFTDLHPGTDGAVSWRQDDDRLAVTYHNMKSFGNRNTKNTFQIVLEASGEVTLAFLHVQPVQDVLVGVSAGGGPSAGEVINLSAAPACTGPDAGLHHHAKHGEAQLFPPATFGFSFTSLTFDANGVAARCSQPADEFPLDPANGVPVDVGDDGSLLVEFPPGFEFPFFGRTWSSVYVGSNGYLTFGQPDIDYDPTLPDHFSRPRISAMFADLHPKAGEVIVTEGDNVMAITYDNVESLMSAAPNSFQILLNATGEVTITYLNTDVGSQAVVGLSSGTAVFPLRSVELAGRPVCAGASPSEPKPRGDVQFFEPADGDMAVDFPYANTTLTFPADGGPPCATDVSTHGVDPTGGRVLRLPDDGNEEVAFEGDFAFPFFGQRYSSMFVSSNGYVTFGEGDWLHSVTELEEHYTHPRVAALFSDLNPPEGSVSVKQLADEAVAVTYAGVPSFASEDAVSNFQITLFASGEVQLSYLEVQPLGATVVGLSAGRLPPDVTSVDLLASGGECEAPPATVSPDVLAASLNVDAVPGDLTLVAYQRNVTFPLANRSLRFAAGGAGSCSAPSAAFSVDPAGGDTVDLIDDNSVEVAFEDGFVFPFFGQEYPSVWVGSNGYLTFGASDTTSFPDLENHYALPRVAALFTDLDPSDGGRVSVKQTADAFAVTYRNIKAYGGQGGGTNTFQVVLSASGEVTVVYKDLDPKRDAIVGLSSGDMPRYPITISTLDDSQPCPAEEAP